MKLYKSIILGAAAICSACVATSCSEEDTLEGANVVFIEMTPSDITMTVGDTIPVSAVVSNESGHTINTPIAWSVDDNSVAELVILKKGFVKGREVARVIQHLSRADGDDDPTGDNQAGEGDDVVTPEPAPVPVDTTWTSTYALLGQRGAQGKNTILRATLENGKYAIAPVAVLAREISGAIKAQTTFIRSYNRNANDTAWFTVTPFQLVDEAQLSYEFRTTEFITTPDNEDDTKFTFNSENPQENIFIDRENKRVGVVYTGPRFAGKAECELTISDGTSSESAVVPIHVYPFVSPGFETFPDRKRPNYDAPNPSNIKLTLMNASIDVNSSYDFGICLGVDMGRDDDLNNVYAMEQAGLMYWEVEGSAVVVENLTTDWDYFSGYVSYLVVRSGAREGISTLRFHLPDTVCTINLTVEDFNKSYPVERIVVRNGQEEVDPAVGVTFDMGTPANLDVLVEPEPSYTYHIPEVTSSDPSIIEVNPIGEDAGYSRSFTLHKMGTAVITVTSLDKTFSFPVTVNDRVVRVAWSQLNNYEVMAGATSDIEATVHMASGNPAEGDISWIVGDPSIASVTAVPGSVGRATIKGLKAGTTTLVAEYKGVRSSVETITVTEANDIIMADIPEDERYSGDNGDGTLCIGAADIEIYIPWITEGVYDGTYVGSDALVVIAGNPQEGVDYSLTITDNGSDGIIVSGTVTLPNGVKIVFNSDLFYY